MNRRTALKSVGAMSIPMVLTGTAAAGEDGGQVLGQSESKPVIDAEDAEVRVTTKGDGLEPRVYAGKYQNYPQSHADQIEAEDWSGSLQSPSFYLPHELPDILAGTEIYAELSASIDWDGGDVSLALVVDGYEISLGGVGFSTGNSEFCLDAKKIRIYGIPFTVKGCITIDPDFSDPSVTLGGSLKLCLLESDPCEDLDWVDNYSEWIVTSCQPCLTGLELEGTVP